jgi:PKD domain
VNNHRWVRLALASLVAVVMAACSGGGDEPAAQTKKPTAVVTASAQAVSTDGSASVQTSLGATVALDASGSSAGSGTIASTAWTVTARPAGSTATVSGAAAALARFTPDAVGSYTIEMQVTDTAGGSAKTTVTLTVGATPATPNVVSAVSFSGPSTVAAPQGTAVGAPVTLDASASADPSGGTLTLSWEITRKPTGSSAALTVTGPRAVFTPDLVGEYEVRVRGTAAAGNWAESVHNYTVNDGAPRVLVSGSVTAPLGQGSALNAGVGNVVALQGFVANCCSSLSDESWTLVSKPFGSTIGQLTPNGTSAVRFVPDASGAYVIQYAARLLGAASMSFYTVTVQVSQAPRVVVSATASPVASATAPSFVAAPGQPVTLRGGGSHDPAGGTISYSWRLASAPVGGHSALATATAVDTQFTPTVVGRYEVELTVTADNGLRAVQSVVLLVGTTVPTALVERSSATVLVGQAARVSAAPSSTASGNALTYSWAIDARPVGSTASIANPAAAQLDFVPDLPGTYSATVTVSDGPLSAVAPLTIVALSPSAGVMPLTYAPGLTRFNAATGKAVIASTAPDTLHVVDPVALTDVAIALPAPAKALSVSPSGRWAAVLHDNTATLVDLANGAVARSFFTLGTKSDLVALDSGVVVLAGMVTTSPYSSQAGYVVVDGATGNTLQTLPLTQYFGNTFRVLHANLGNRLVAFSECCSSSLQLTTVDPTTSLLAHVATSGNLNYVAGTASWLTGDQAYLVNSASSLYRASDFTLLGTLLNPNNSGTQRLLSFSHSAAADEAIGLELPVAVCCDYSPRLPSVFKRWTGAFFFASADITLPRIGGEQSYGLAVFHAADNKRVLLVQTGSDRQVALGLRHYLVLR